MKGLLLDWAYGVDIDSPLPRIVACSPPAFSSFSLLSVRQAPPPSTLSLDFSSSQRRPAGLSLWPTGPGCHARGYRRFLREVVPAAGARQSSPLATTIFADDAPGERQSFERPVTLSFFSRDRINCPIGTRNSSRISTVVLEISLGASYHRCSQVMYKFGNFEILEFLELHPYGPWKVSKSIDFINLQIYNILIFL